MYIPPSLAFAAESFKKGEFVIIVDSSLREDEADLAILAEKATPKSIAFMVKHTGGVICTPITQPIADRLQLNQMVINNTEVNRTAFTVSIDYKFNTTSGISASDRALTCQALANPKSAPTDFNRPGHLFPLLAKKGGVLERPGHTEAAIELCQFIKASPVAVISELIGDDGDLMRGQELLDFSKKFNIPIIQVDTLIAYRKSLPTDEKTNASYVNNFICS